MNTKRSRGFFSRLLFSALFLSFTGLSFIGSGFSGCNLLITAVGELTNERYISGREAKMRLQSAALIGYGLNSILAPSSASFAKPIVSLIATRIAEDRRYLESAVESCEETLWASNMAGVDFVGQFMAGLICNLGPGRDPNEI